MFIINEEQKSLYLGIDEFSSAGFGYKKDDSALRVINKIEDSNISNVYLENFDKVWSDEKILKDVTLDVLTYMDNLYKENSPEFVYYLILYHIFSEFL
ncbi:hypothetical protein [Aliarcobacter cryaerophilus]|nr:hypothetical protein [Aliarcobacter cryaerophilus]